MTEARKLEASNDFLIVNRGVARRPITPMGAPALVLNYVFWRPEKTEPKIWRQQIDRFLWHIFVQSLPNEPLPSKPSADDYFDALIWFNCI